MTEDEMRGVVIGDLQPLSGAIELAEYDPAWPGLYARTKRELARREWQYVQSYADAKTAVVEEIVARAREGLSRG